jgi:hypothetical protein
MGTAEPFPTVTKCGVERGVVDMMLPSLLVMWEVAPVSITHDPCWRPRLLRAAMRLALSQDGAVEVDGADW